MIYICTEPRLLGYIPFLAEIDGEYRDDVFFLHNCLMPARQHRGYVNEDLKGCWSNSKYLLDFNPINIIKYFGDERYFTEEFKNIIKKELFSKI